MCSEFFKKSDRDRHMRSKHDSAAVVCTECDITLSNKLEYDMHMEISHERRRSRSLTCQTCGGRYPTKVALTDHINRCHSLKE